MKRSYMITEMPEPGHYSIWYEGLPEPYLTVLKPGKHTCTCPHWLWRIRKPGLQCKHHALIKKEGAWNQTYTT